MGCTISYTVVHPATTFVDNAEPVDFSRPFAPPASDSLWKLLPSSPEARMKFVDDGTLNMRDTEPGHLELRFILDDPMSQSYIGKYAEHLQVLDLFMCWIDIQEYKSIPTENYRRSKALHIFHKYIAVGAELSVGGISDNVRFSIQEVLELSLHQPSLLTYDFYDRVQSICFIEMYHNIYVPFRNTKEFEELAGRLRNKYNKVSLDDFEYFGRMGDDSEEGFIARCRKKSTGKYYAMKLQTKKDLLENFKNDLTQVDQEKHAFSIFQHPFIVSMDYAFQTESLAIIATALATQVNLKNILETSQLGRLTEDRVQFYAAEVVLALSYVHSLGMIYRDLKPQNILMGSDGNVQLADVGGIMYGNGVVLRHINASSILSIFAYNEPNKRSFISVTSERADETKRMKRISVNGAIGDMAPEMVILMHERKKYMLEEISSGRKPRPPRQKYNKSVDWWSLGVTMYTLLTGYRPFKDELLNDFVTMVLSTDHNIETDGKEYAALFQEISFPSYVSKEARNLITRLLDVNDKTRLGAGDDGDEDIKSHPFFKGVDWNELELRRIEPPAAPLDYIDLVNEKPYPSLEALLADHDKQFMLKDLPPADKQKFFMSWDFTSTHTIRVESGLAHIMDQYDKKSKIRRVLGELQSAPSFNGGGGSGSSAPTPTGAMMASAKVYRVDG